MTRLDDSNSRLEARLAEDADLYQRRVHFSPDRPWVECSRQEALHRRQPLMEYRALKVATVMVRVVTGIVEAPRPPIDRLDDKDLKIVAWLNKNQRRQWAKGEDYRHQTASQVASAVGNSKDATKDRLKRLAALGHVAQTGPGHWRSINFLPYEVPYV